MAGTEGFDVYLEVGRRRTFAAALDWPGWCRQGRDEGAALSALAAYGPRYGAALAGSGTGYEPPADPLALRVADRLEGDAATDFGVAHAIPSADARPLTAEDAARLRTILRACWRTLDEAVAGAEGRTLTTGPRGGGRDLDAIVRHVAEADAGYLAKVARRLPKDVHDAPAERVPLMRDLISGALDAGVRGDIPERGPRGGTLWTARYLARRVAWHTLDHAWEIEDRVEG